MTDLSRPRPKALYVSGNFGAGRRTVVRKFFENYLPQVGQVFPVINVERFSGFHELYRTVLSALRPTMPVAQMAERIQAFDESPPGERAPMVADVLNALLPGRETALVLDNGGLLADSGALMPEWDDVLNHLRTSPHPPVAFISPRMISRRFRRRGEDMAYLAVGSLAREATERIISALLRSRDMDADVEQLDALVDLSDSHPFQHLSDDWRD